MPESRVQLRHDSVTRNLKRTVRFRSQTTLSSRRDRPILPLASINQKFALTSYRYSHHQKPHQRKDSSEHIGVSPNSKVKDCKAHEF